MPLTDRYTRRCRTLIRLIFVSGISLSVFACGINFKGFNLGSSKTTEQILVPTPQLATRLLAEGEIAQAADIYEKLAATETDPSLRQEYLLKATELYFDGTLYNDGIRTFAALPPIPTSELGNNTIIGASGPQPRLQILTCLLYTSPSPRDGLLSRMPSSA